MLRLVVATIAVLGFFASAFQNCSPVAVQDLTEEARVAAARVLRIGAGEVTVEVGASQYEKSTSTFNVGLESVPPLKQVWIVDNSGTMEANNLNLSNSFGAMFNQNNQNSLYKFETTSYLMSTAQTIPSYSSSLRGVITDIANRQNYFLKNGVATESDFVSNYRSDTLNSGKVPGDNVGIAVSANGSSSTDFKVDYAPVLGKSPSSPTFKLVPSITKPANTDTTEFEKSFKDRLVVLNSSRVPQYEKSPGLYVQQSNEVLDKESGLCAVARVLDNPNGLFSNSDMLAFTIVTDENENDVQGRNCLKRTAYSKGDVDLIDGKCVEYETPFQIAQRSRDPRTCTLSGQAGYRADFAYTYFYANISYYGVLTPEKIASTTPQTKVSWTTPTTVTTYKQLQSTLTYYTQKTNPAVYSYKVRRIPVEYYTPVCTQTSRDGILTTTCVASATSIVGYVDAATYSTCPIAARSLNAKAIIEPTETIPASKLPNCSQTEVWQVVASCNTADSANCQKNLVTAPSTVIDQGPLVKVLVGDHQADCNAAATSTNPAAVVSTSALIGADKLPKCSAANFVTLTGGATCTASATCQIIVSEGTPAPGNKIVLGNIPNGSANCIANAAVNAISGSISCASTTARTTNVACKSDELAAGCTSIVTPETNGYKSGVDVANIKTSAECDTWVSAKSDNRTDGSHPVVCNLKTLPKIASATRSFTEVANSSLNVGDLCGATASTFYSALSAADKNLVSPATISTTCKIGQVTTLNSQVRPLNVGQTCASQMASDCSALNMRACSTVDSGGDFTASYGSVQPFSRIRMKDIGCNTKCTALPAGACESWSSQDITFAQYLSNKYGADIQTQCSTLAPVEQTPVISTIVGRPASEQLSFCSASNLGVPRYFVATRAVYRTEGYFDEFVAGNSQDGKSPKTDLIQFIKNKIVENNLNVNFTVFIRRSIDPDGVGNGISYKGVDYEKMVNELTGSGDPSKAVASAQVYSVLAPSYEQALTNLSSVIKSKLIRSFTINDLKAYQIVTAIKIEPSSGPTMNLSIGQWTQSGNVISLANGVTINEGDKIYIQYQNNDGYVYAQLKKSFIIDGMKPEQIIKSIEQIKPNGTTIPLDVSQFIKEGNKVTIVDSKVTIEGGDKFHISFKNDVEED